MKDNQFGTHIHHYYYLIYNHLHLIQAAKNFTEKFLQIKDCPTETKFYIKKEKLLEINNNENKNKFKIIIGAGSSGPTTRWGSKNFSNLINQLNKSDDYFFYILCGPHEKEIENEALKANSILVKSIIENSNLRLIVNKKNYDQIKELFEDFTNDLVESQNKKKIESLEKKLINNMEEKAFTELLKLKSQINRE